MLYFVTIILAMINGFIISLFYKLFHSIRKWYIVPLKLFAIVYIISSMYVPMFIVKIDPAYNEFWGFALNVLFEFLLFYLNIRNKKVR